MGVQVVHDKGCLFDIRVHHVHELLDLVCQSVDAREAAPAAPYRYVAGCMVQSGLARTRDAGALAESLESGAGWLDYPDETLRRVLAMLRIHLRRRG